MIYLDYQATTPCDPTVFETMAPWFTEQFGNPHSTGHLPGALAAEAVERARAGIASLIGAEAREIVLTSGATEANNLAIKGAARHLRAMGDPRRRVITVATEHKCVLESVRDLGAEGFEPVVLPVRADGGLDPDRLHDALRVPTLLVSIMAANNETGVLHDLDTLGPIVREAGALLHSDLAQLAGKLPTSVAGLDLASLSAHKLYGPKGIGALYVRHKPRVRLAPLFSGGGQERGLRSGTIPAMLAVGFGAACVLARDTLDGEGARIAALRDQFWQGLQDALPGIALTGGDAPRVPGALPICLPDGCEAMTTMARAPDLAMSTGSACSSAEIAPSYVLTAMGLDRTQAARCLRLSVGRYTSGADIARATALLQKAALGR
jgi:cysteine desulfurase